MFEHPEFDIYENNNIPLSRDCYLMDEKYLKAFEQYCVNGFNGIESEPVGYICHIAVKQINEHSFELSWYPTYERLHEVVVNLPKDQFIICVGSWRCDEKPHLFVKSGWLKHLYLKQYSVFALIDAADVKAAIEEGQLSRDKLINIRNAIDALAIKYHNISFISFADSLILKSNWTVGTFEDNIPYNYSPETLLYIFQEVQAIYKKHLDLNVYGIFSQGSNEYYDDSMLHISATQNHICLNSLGTPFANLEEIHRTARCCIRNNTHPKSEVYMDEDFYRSLKLKFDFEEANLAKQNYVSKIGKEQSVYYYTQCQHILDNLREEMAYSGRVEDSVVF
ncbi:MAG: hypothetical protein FJX03_07700 [Alphaproteobacteria bacterium]|nr:hypothetical protein [Alphaproteobacteria bacterium]